MNGKSDIDQLRADLDALKADLVRITRDSRDVAGRRADAAGVKARGEFEELVRQVAATIEEAKGHGAARLHAFERQVEERPFVSLASAFAVGLLIGRVLDRR